jgi:hypothetical protein
MPLAMPSIRSALAIGSGLEITVRLHHLRDHRTRLPIIAQIQKPLLNRLARAL